MRGRCGVVEEKELCCRLDFPESASSTTTNISINPCTTLLTVTNLRSRSVPFNSRIPSFWPISCGFVPSMTLEDNVYCGDLQRSLQVQRPLDETSEKANEVSNRIRSLYDAGVPFYSKEAIRYINRQLKNGSEKVLVKGIDGVVVDIEVETGQPFDMGDQDTDFVMSVSQMLEPQKRSFKKKD